MRVLPVGDFFQAAPVAATELEWPDDTVWEPMPGCEPRYGMSTAPGCPPGWSVLYVYDTTRNEWLITIGDEHAPRFVSLGRYLSARQAEVMLTGWCVLERDTPGSSTWDGAPRSNPVVAWWPL